jgi:hypothetical protein
MCVIMYDSCRICGRNRAEFGKMIPQDVGYLMECLERQRTEKCEGASENYTELVDLETYAPNKKAKDKFNKICITHVCFTCYGLLEDLNNALTINFVTTRAQGRPSFSDEASYYPAALLDAAYNAATEGLVTTLSRIFRGQPLMVWKPSIQDHSTAGLADLQRCDWEWDYTRDIWHMLPEKSSATEEEILFELTALGYGSLGVVEGVAEARKELRRLILLEESLRGAYDLKQLGEYRTLCDPESEDVIRVFTALRLIKKTDTKRHGVTLDEINLRFRELEMCDIRGEDIEEGGMRYRWIDRIYASTKAGDRRC